jgi:hypothetical protein
MNKRSRKLRSSRNVTPSAAQAPPGPLSSALRSGAGRASPGGGRAWTGCTLRCAMRIYLRAASPFAACRARCTRGANAPMQYVVSPCRRWPELEAPKKLAVQHARAGGCQCVVVLTPGPDRMRSPWLPWPQEAWRQANGIRLPTRGRTRAGACHPRERDRDRLTSQVRRCVSDVTHYLN